jgi:hypothetical protein
MSITKAVADVSGDVLAFGIGSQEIAILLRWRVKVAVEFAAAEEQIKPAFSATICGCRKDARI